MTKSPVNIRSLRDHDLLHVGYGCSSLIVACERHDADETSTSMAEQLFWESKSRTTATPGDKPVIDRVISLEERGSFFHISVEFVAKAAGPYGRQNFKAVIERIVPISQVVFEFVRLDLEHTERVFEAFRREKAARDTERVRSRFGRHR